jgi:molybdate transport system substrate-binding protein
LLLSFITAMILTANKLTYLLLLSALLLPGMARATDVRLAAAASLRELAGEAAARFERSHPGDRVLISTASSGTLARQIEAGAPIDLFLSANPQWMEALLEKGKIGSAGCKVWAANRLVVVGRGAALTALGQLAAVTRLAIGSAESVPAGRYARSMLEAAGLYDTLAKEHKLVMAKDVRQALLYAEQGTVDAAIIYASDTRLLRQARIVLVPAANLQPNIRYPIALTRTGEQNPAARELLALLTSAEGQELITAYGLVPLPGTEGAQ